MELCTVDAPEHPSGANPSRPILLVKHNGRVLAYATYRDSQYEFPAAPEVCEAIANHTISVAYAFDGEIPTAILLSDVITAEHEK